MTTRLNSGPKTRISAYFDPASMAVLEPNLNRTARLNVCLQRYAAMIVPLVPELTVEEWKAVFDAIEASHVFRLYHHLDSDVDPLKDIIMPNPRLRQVMTNEIDRILVAEIASRYFNYPQRRKPLYLILRELGLDLPDPAVPPTEFVSPLTAQPRRPLSPG